MAFSVITNALPHLKCLSSVTNLRFLASGTIGTVYYGCEAKNKCYAIKLQLIKTARDQAGFEQEVAAQKAFAPFAPKIRKSCTESVGSHTFGIIMMELVTTLDEYLSVRRPESELQKVIRGIGKMLQFLQNKEYTHGDLALFNMAVNQKNKVIMLDFDRSTVQFCHQKLDILRILSEWYSSTQSRNTKKLNKFNVEYMKNNGFPVWLAIDPVPYKTASAIEAAWTIEYNKYCKKARVKCL